MLGCEIGEDERVEIDEALSVLSRALGRHLKNSHGTSRVHRTA